MFFLSKNNGNKRIEALMKRRSPFEIKTKKIGAYTLLYEERESYKVIQNKKEFILYYDGSLYPYKDYVNGNGIFFILKISHKTDKIEIMTDLLNSLPIFYTKELNAWSSHLFLLQKQQINADILDYILILGYNPFFGCTLFRNVLQTLPGCHYSINRGVLTWVLSRNSIFSYLPSKEIYDETNIYQKLDTLYKHSVKKVLKRLKTVHLQLSGGVDTRGCLSEFYRQYKGRIYTHGYGPSSFSDNIIADQIAKRMPRISHTIYDLNRGEDLLENLDEVIFHSSLNTDLYALFRCFVVSKSIKKKEEPIISSVLVDSMLGDETKKDMSAKLKFSESNKEYFLSFFSNFYFPYSFSVFSPSKIELMKKKLKDHYNQFLPNEISEIDAYDTLNILVRHGKGNLGMLHGTLAYRPMIIPQFNKEMLQFSFQISKQLKYGMIGYMSYLNNFCYDTNIRDIPTTRSLMPLSAYVNLLSKKQKYPQILSKIRFGMIKKLLLKSLPFSGKNLDIEECMQEDYFYSFYKHNKRFKDFVVKNVRAFDKRKFVEYKYSHFLKKEDAHKIRILIIIAILNEAIK